MNPKYMSTISELDNHVGLASRERDAMETVSDKFPFRSNEYYLSLIDWKDGHDPLRRIVIPDPSELHGGGCLDPSCEKDFTGNPAYSINMHRRVCYSSPMSAAVSAASASGNACSCPANARP